MTSNHKLTTLIKGRTISGTGNANNVLTVSFTDGSLMTVQTQGSTNSASTGGTIKAVQQSGTTLALMCEDGSMQTIETAEETSSVMVRGKDHTMEYAD